MDDALRMLADAATAFARVDGKRTRAARSLPGGFDPATWAAMGEQGWLAILAPEAVGGAGLGIDAAVIVAERLGYAGLREPFVPCGVMATHLLGRSDNDALQARTLPAVLEGRTIVSVAWQDASGALEPGSSAVGAQRSGASATLDGVAALVPVPTADAFIVAAHDATGVSLWFVPRDQAGLTIHAEPLADGTSMGRLAFASATLRPDACIADGSVAHALLAEAIDLATIASAAELLGVMERALELTLEYLRTRKQFGKPIGSFQALQHRAVDLWIARELSRAALDSAVTRAMDPQTLAPARGAAASAARARATQSAFQLLNQAIQLHGAIGFTDEYDLGLAVNRGLALIAWPGDARTHRRRYARLSAATQGGATS